jgi:hypothetical protein
MGKLALLAVLLFLIWLAIRVGRFAIRLVVFTASMLLIVVVLYFVLVR